MGPDSILPTTRGSPSSGLGPRGSRWVPPESLGPRTPQEQQPLIPGLTGQFILSFTLRSAFRNQGRRASTRPGRPCAGARVTKTDRVWPLASSRSQSYVDE